MKKSRLLGAVGACATTLALSTSANAALITQDLNTLGDGLITLDTDTGLEWLDLTATTARSHSDISSQLGAGGEFDGWRYATSDQVGGLLDAFGGNNLYYNGWQVQNNGLFDAVSAYWGENDCHVSGCTSNLHTMKAIMGDPHVLYEGFRYVVTIGDDDDTVGSHAGKDYIAFTNPVSPGYSSEFLGSALVRDVSTVPVPAAVWLFGSGLLGLIGIARRKKTA